MNSLQRTTIVFLLTLFTAFCQDEVYIKMAETSTFNNNVAGNHNKMTDNTVHSRYNEDSSCIYIHDAEYGSSANENNQNGDGFNDSDRDFELFQLFTKKFNKVYSNDNEHNNRLQIFKANLKKTKNLQEQEQGTAIYGITKFFDLTENEFKEIYLGFILNNRSSELPIQQAIIPDDPIPPQFDWRTRGAVTPVKNQKLNNSCGSCWAFSTVGNIEGVWANKHHELESLSAQELVDCDNRSSGCQGGLPIRAYKSIMELGGLETEKDYPYKAKEMPCSFNKTKVKVTISGYIEISNDEQKMAQWLVKNAPMSVTVNATPVKLYCKGVFHPTKSQCDPAALNHAVVIVGYGVEKLPNTNNEIPFWIVKNSWGLNWGEEGYFRIYRGDGTCGINTNVVSATVD